MRLLEYTLDTFFPVSGEAALPGQNRNRQFVGTGISFCVHVSVVCLIFFLGPSLSDFQPPLVIDFSIEQSRAPAKVKKEIFPPVEKPAPIAQQPLREEVVLPEISPLAKMEVAKTPKIVPLEKEKKIVEEIPEPVIEEQIEPKPEEIVAEQEVPPSAQVTQKNSAPKPQETTQVKQQKYYKEHFKYIQDSVQKKITYPRIARKMGWQGKVLISFIICIDGTIKDIQIVESSGHKALDKNALEIVQKVAPFPKPPVAAKLIIPVVYNLI